MPKFERTFIKATNRVFTYIRIFQQDGRSQVVVKGTLLLIGVAVNYHILKYDVGITVFTPEFLVLLMLWAVFAGVVLVDELQRAKEKTTSKKVDGLEIKIDATNSKIGILVTNINTLINEIRQDRNERNNKQ